MIDWRTRIRAAWPHEDAAALADLSSQLGCPSTAAQMYGRLASLDDPERDLLVAEAPDDLAGFIHVHVQRTVEDQPYREVGGLVIATPHRGAGLGAALLSAAADWRRACGLERLRIPANLARVHLRESNEAVGCRVVRDQRVYEHLL